MLNGEFGFTLLGPHCHASGVVGRHCERKCRIPTTEYVAVFRWVGRCGDFLAKVGGDCVNYGPINSVERDGELTDSPVCGVLAVAGAALCNCHNGCRLNESGAGPASEGVTLFLRFCKCKRIAFNSVSLSVNSRAAIQIVADAIIDGNKVGREVKVLSHHKCANRCRVAIAPSNELVTVVGCGNEHCGVANVVGAVALNCAVFAVGCESDGGFAHCVVACNHFAIDGQNHILEVEVANVVGAVFTGQIELKADIACASLANCAFNGNGLPLTFGNWVGVANNLVAVSVKDFGVTLIPLIICVNIRL